MIITGTPYLDVLYGSVQADEMYGLAGIDYLYPLSGDDVVHGGEDSDYVEGSAGNDTIFGDGGDDRLIGGPGDDRIEGGAGNDTLFGDPQGANTMLGGDGDDLIWVYDAFAGAIEVATSNPQVVLAGGDGADRFQVMPEFGHVAGVPINDNWNNLITDFEAGPGGDLLDLVMQLEASTYYAGYAGGNPFAQGFFSLTQSGPDTLLRYDRDGPSGPAQPILIATLQGVGVASLAAENFGGIAPDGSPGAGLVISGTGSLVGGVYDDQISGSGRLDGGAGADTLTGGAGADTLEGGAGNDLVYGGEGDDHLNAPLGQYWPDDQQFVFSHGDDTLYGGDGNDVLVDQRGHNVLDGGAGNDWFSLSSPDGVTTNLVTGGDGRDIFALFRSTPSGQHVITDFATGPGGDRFDLDVEIGVSTEEGYASGNPFDPALGFFRLRQSGPDQLGPDVLLQWDRDGAGGSAYSWATVATVQGTTVAQLTSDNFLGGIAPDGSPVAGLLKVGTDGAETINGAVFNDTLEGLDGNDFLFGRSGGDLMDGGAGHDTLIGGAGNDTQYGGDGSDSFMQWLNTDLVALNGDDLMIGGPGSDVFSDNIGSNTMEGGEGDDVLWVSTTAIGSSFASGGEGRDTYWVQQATAGRSYTVTEFEPGPGGDRLSVKFLLDYSGMLLAYSSGDPFRPEIGILRLTQAGADTLLQADFDGPAGSGAWKTQLTLQNVARTSVTSDNFLGQLILGTPGNDLLKGDWTNDTLIGLAGNDTLDGGPGDNILKGDEGTDVALLPGTLGSYTVTILDPGSAGQASYDPGFGLQPGDIVNIVNESGRIDRLAGVEKVRFLGDPAVSGDEVEYDITASGLLRSAVLRNGDAYQADVFNTGSLIGGALDDVLDGLGGADTLQGGAGDDLLIGGAGNDTLVGGEGNDRYMVDAVGDQVIEMPANGLDRVQAVLATYSLPGDVEILEFAGTGAFHGTGNPAANVVIGRTGADLLEGAAGHDLLIGAGGNDTLDGGAGSDTLDGGTGNDLVVLGGNPTTYAFDDLPAGVRVTDLQSSDTDWLLNVERVRFEGGVEAVLQAGGPPGPGQFAYLATGTAGDDHLYGVGGEDTLLGGTGNDTLEGSGGGDLMQGGTGNDTYLVDDPRDAVGDTSGSNDQVVATLAMTSIASMSGIEELVLAGAAWLGIGSSRGDLITGNGEDNVLFGGEGADTLAGGAGDDELRGELGADRFVFDSLEGVDTVVRFEAGERLAFDNAAFTQLGAEGALAAGAFRAGVGLAQGGDADDRLVFDSASGKLYYDADGAGGEPSLQVAQLGAFGALTAADIVVA